MPSLRNIRYGKSCVRLARLDSNNGRKRVRDLSVDIEVTGRFESSYTEGDNRDVIATDTMKNTVFVLARRHPGTSVEAFGALLAENFITRYEQVSTATVRVEERPWEMVPAADGKATGTLTRTGQGLDTASVSCKRGSPPTITSGLSGLEILRTSGCSFSSFHVDDMTTLRDDDDRLVATRVEATWTAPDPTHDHEALRARVRRTLLVSFADHSSKSLQQTLYRMGTAVLESCPEVAGIDLEMPNLHHHRVDLSPFGLENAKTVFQPADAPYGVICATLRREE